MKKLLSLILVSMLLSCAIHTKGADGQRGKDGKSGTNGEKGQDGKNGADGSDKIIGLHVNKDLKSVKKIV